MADYQNVLNSLTGEAEDFLNNPDRMDKLMIDLEAKLKQIPAIGESVSELPVMVSMVKSWIKKEYDFSPKVMVTMVAAFIYLVKKNDIINDSVPVIGIADDIAVLGLALKFVEGDVKAYKSWRGDPQ